MYITNKISSIDKATNQWPLNEIINPKFGFYKCSTLDYIISPHYTITYSTELNCWSL